ncbi:MAG: alpha/beta fold hydrolase [Chitinophagales bacterium]|nr:alpha/beta fold hydrolase [Chitinophagales bacterium]
MVLNYKLLGEDGEDIIILHGLLGTLDNWHSIARVLSEKYKVWLVDQRNHGYSPHSEEMNYQVMAEDIKDFMSQHQIVKTHIIGHSMGGKVAMNFSMLYPEKILKLMVVDIGPKPYIGDHLPILEAMLNIHPNEYDKRTDIQDLVSTLIHSDKLVQFILKNLGRTAKEFYWKPNVEVLYYAYRALMDFTLPDKTFEGVTYFIKGGDSDYIQVDEWKDYLKFFPHAKLLIVPHASHWVHADYPEVFLQLISEALEE